MASQKKPPSILAVTSEGVSNSNSATNELADSNITLISPTRKKQASCKPNFLITAEITNDEGVCVRPYRGRNGWTLNELIKADKEGVTPIDNPAPRWSEYVSQLRKNGLSIITHHEKHDGAFPGTHGRYELVSKVRILALCEGAKNDCP